MKKLLSFGMTLLLMLTMLLAFSACGTSNDVTPTSTDSTETKSDKAPAEAPAAESDTSAAAHDRVEVQMKDGGKFVIELYPEYAPETVENFKTLVSEGFYDGLTFHRVVDGFMAQGGDPLGTGMGGSDKTIKGEFATNNFAQNTLSHTRGVVSMARSSAPDSASSQFFICYDDATFLDGQYAAFGKVVEGMDVVDGFLDVERKANSMGEIATPVTPIVMEKLTLLPAE